MKKLPTILILLVLAVIIVVGIFLINQPAKENNSNQSTKSYVSSMLAEPLSLEERINQAEVIIRGTVKEQLPSQRVKKENSEYIYTDNVV